MTDYISRDEAVALAMEYCTDDDGSCTKAGHDLRELLDDLENAPAADVRPVVRGEWIFDSDNLPICSECQEIALQRMFVKIPSLIQDVRMVRSNFCPFCGADMRGKEAGTDV